ncbi:sugar ABC transporter permease [Marinomonas sp. UCMA 3892]|jgi:putative spermidine/putrescine transport system permease protein|uniref:Binding-protein-dependent transport systems inner membrane component n=1 Tax=Marinomonas sp. (strain MWYL1) TaxID=400668 RepID=A6VRP4_MARMS|nr:sugar ABC transporter permease [Marinomonas sp. UCMA 3892]NLU97639.1 sugar ABC transporter permease [Marinomonas sp. UCMA 3892]|tara:strand:+ start:12663 stop:13511 length:849 start_codon:yes stop_codon:yes gene_type:complete
MRQTTSHNLLKNHLWLIAPAALMVGIFFLYPLCFSLYSAITLDSGEFTLTHLNKAFELYSKDILFTIIIVLISVAILAVLSITIAALITLSPFRSLSKILGFLYRLPLFIPFIVTAQMMRSFLAKNGLMNNAFVASGLLTPMDTVSFLGWSGIIITFVWKQLAFSTLLISGAMAALDDSQIRAARNLGASRLRILFQIILPQITPTLGVAMVLSIVTMMSVLSVPLMIGTGSPTMMTADMAFRINSYGDYHVANALGLVSYCICAGLAWFYLRQNLKEKGAN